jgi:hypothetical protein
MTAETRNVVGHHYSIANLEPTRITPDLCYLASDLVTQDHGLVQLLKPDLVNIRKTNPTGLDLEQQVPVLKRRSWDLLDSRLLILRNDGFHRVRWALFTRD